MDIQDTKEQRQAFDEWHYEQYLLENPNIDISNAKYIYDYAHKNVLVFQLRESHFTAWQAAIARMEVRINTLDETLLNQGEALAQAKAKVVPEWISVKRGMPKAGSRVLTYDDYGFADVATIDGCEDPNNVYFSYWLLLPDAPIKAQEPAND